MVDTIIFDFYGTLVYNPNYKSTDIFPYVQFLNALGADRSWIDRVLTENIALETIHQIVNPKLDIDIDSYYNKINKDIEKTICFDETIPILKLLSNNYKLFVLSNAATPYKEPFYRLGLDKLAIPYFSCDIGVRKPDKVAFDLVLGDIPRNQALMVGDSLISDYYGGINAGLNAVHKTADLKSTLKSVGIKI